MSEASKPTISLPAWLERLLSPGISTCYRCRRPWRTAATRRIGVRAWRQLDRDRFYGHVGVEAHNTDYQVGSGMFPLCKGCWSELTISERLPHYRRLYDHWVNEALRIKDGEYFDEVYAKWPLIERAVLSGL